MIRRRPPSGSVPPLRCSVPRTVRFEEVDPLNIMWHGRYASWLEDGRETLGKAFGIHYLDFYAHNVAIPLKIFQLDFKQPLRYGQTYTVHTSLLWNEAALLDMEYRIEDAAGQLMTMGWTTQLMVDLQGGLQLEKPLFFRDFCDKWQAGILPAAGVVVPVGAEDACR